MWSYLTRTLQSVQQEEEEIYPKGKEKENTETRG